MREGCDGKAPMGPPGSRKARRRLPFVIAAGLALVLLQGACAPELYQAEYVRRANAWLDHFARYRPRQVLRGQVTYYHDSLAGNHTANGEIYDPRMLTAASRTLPFGTIVRVVRLDNGRQVTLRINDRGPYGKKRRLLDLSRAAANRIGIITRGVADVRAEILWAPAHVR